MKKSDKNYFTQETENYIVKYNTSTDPVERAKIFTDHIYLPFYKLAENIIHTFKFYYMDVDSEEDLKHEIVTMLLEEKINKFDPSVGAKAYSYFGTIVKRWLISYNSTNYRKLKKRKGLEEVSDLEMDPEELEIDTLYSVTLSSFIDRWAEDIKLNLHEMFEKQEERDVAVAILKLFEDRSDLMIYKKKTLYLYIREMTKCETPYLTKVITRLRKDFYIKYQRYVDQGLILAPLP